MPDLNDHLRWRYATKTFDPAKKLTQQQLDDLLEALRLSPSSFGLQPYSFIVVENPEIRARLQAVSWNQSQVTDASHLIALCAKRTVDSAYVDECLREIASVRGLPVDALKGYRDRIGSYLLAKKPAEILEWAKRQTYIALGFLLSAAALMGVDSCPMEGFDPEQVDCILDLRKDDLTIVALCPVGFRAPDDAFASAKKVRFGMGKLVRRT
jgi:nitroreductase